MIYNSAQDWQNAKHKRVLLFGMSGLGKTYLSNMLHDAGDWYHYSIDYRIGTKYMGKHLEADPNVSAADITIENLSPLSDYLGKPGDSALGGMPIEEYRKRQSQHKSAEIAALFDSVPFIERGSGFDNFICDSGGSICEVVDPNDPNDALLKTLSENLLLVWIKGTKSHSAELARRFDASPKPMYYQPAFLDKVWSEYSNDNSMKEVDINPDNFVRYAYRKALAHRQPLYADMAKNWGVTVDAMDVAKVNTPQAFDDLIASALVST